MTVKGVKLALIVDKHTYPEQKVFPESKRRELIERADAFSLRHPPYLRALLNIHGQRLGESERELVQEIANTGKEIFYHAGSGIVEEHVYHVPTQDRKSEIIRDGGFSKFQDDGYFEVLDVLGIDFISFNFGPGNKIIYVYSQKKVLDGRGFRRWYAEDSIHRKDWIEIFKAKLGAIRQIYQGRLAFENIPLHPGLENRGWMNYVCHADFISDVFREVKGIHFLLDLCHAQVTAARLGMSVEQYLKALPLTRVIEIHISSTERKGNTVFEAHGIPREGDLSLLKWLIKEKGVNPEYITIEHFHEENLARSFDEVGDFLAGL